jgi:1-aminocyclopropane-1-carboxylate deaminase/D-cysteine desulfhydrase-like pyridoxal-dependent ACC family enzyme
MKSIIRDSFSTVTNPSTGIAGAASTPAAMTRIALLDSLRLRPRVVLGRWPTPIEEATLADGRPVLVKRDDLCGWGRGGAKARKIEHLIGHLSERGHDVLITAAGNITNLAFDLLPALARHGIEPRLLLVDEPAAPARVRAELFAGLGGGAALVSRRWAPALARAASLALAARVRGRRPFLLLPGASHPAAVIGNACGFVEMVEQRLHAGRPLPAQVFVTAATGTTVAGFLLAEHALRASGCAPIRVTGVQVYPGALRARTLALLRWTERFLGWADHVPAERIDLRAEWLHGGFGRYPAELIRLCEDLRERAGLAVDPIFGGKTWAAMEASAVGTEGPTLYWHCGFTPEWRELGSRYRMAA